MSGSVMRIDAFAGISGDMFLGALTDIARGMDPSFDLAEVLSVIKADGWSVEVSEGKRAGIAGVKVDVRCGEHHPHRHLADIEDILGRSGLPPRVREMSSRAFALLAEAEAKVHGTTPDKIHFHEVGAIDAIIDITGVMLLMDRLGWPRVVSSPVNVGSGTVECAHGVLPVPAPAVAALLTGVETYARGEAVERTTPTGAALLRALADEGSFTANPAGRIVRVGTGLGGRDTAAVSNALRVMLLETADEGGRGRFETDTPNLIEANIDDMSPQDFAAVMEKLLGAGALDAWCENILMKKGRPAVKLACLSPNGRADELSELILRETTTLGVRVTDVRRVTLRREIERVSTTLGSVRVKKAMLDGETLRVSPEYEDLAAIAREQGLSMPEARARIAREI